MFCPELFKVAEPTGQLLFKKPGQPFMGQEQCHWLQPKHPIFRRLDRNKNFREIRFWQCNVVCLAILCNELASNVASIPAIVAQARQLLHIRRGGTTLCGSKSNALERGALRQTRKKQMQNFNTSLGLIAGKVLTFLKQSAPKGTGQGVKIQHHVLHLPVQPVPFFFSIYSWGCPSPRPSLQ